MPKHFFKKFIPEHQKIREHKYLQVFGKLHLDPNLWHLNRYSVATAFSVGLFTAFMPIPFQMIMAALLAILFRCNLPLAVALVWISNPFTYAPIFYFSYKIGGLILSATPEPVLAESVWLNLGAQFNKIWSPLLIGLFVCGIISAILGNIVVRVTWRIGTALKWRARKFRVSKGTLP